MSLTPSSKFCKEVHLPNHATILREVTVQCFRDNFNWKEDIAVKLMSHFGVGYDPATIIAYSNSKGCGFIEKLVTRAENNARTDLRQSKDRHLKVSQEGLPPEDTETRKKRATTGKCNRMEKKGKQSHENVEEEEEERMVSFKLEHPLSFHHTHHFPVLDRRSSVV
jgi:hypothetical protein